VTWGTGCWAVPVPDASPAVTVTAAGACRASSQSYAPSELVPGVVYDDPVEAVVVAALVGSIQVAVYPAGGSDWLIPNVVAAVRFGQ